MTDYFHKTLPCGVELGVLPLPGRRIVSFQIRVLAGVCSEPVEKLGLARILAETIDKGTEERTGRELSDAFDAIGANVRIGTGRETTTLACTVLPEHFDRALALHAEMLRRPTFPEDAVRINVELAQQELVALDDDAHALADKLLGRRAYGPVLGRHSLGEPETLSTIVREDLVRHWRSHIHAGRMLVSAAGAVDPAKAADAMERHVEGFGDASSGGRESFPLQFTPGSAHFDKPLEQEQIGICWAGVDATHEDYPVQQVLLGILSGGMSGRLFTEVREKLGLVYWVNAWHETPRGAGMLFMGASTTPQRCTKTLDTLIREIERLAEDIQTDELQRAVTGLLAQIETRGDSTRARCAELVNDLFLHGRPVSDETRIAQLQRVGIDDVRRFLAAHPCQPRCVVTLGPVALDGAGDGARAAATVECRK